MGKTVLERTVRKSKGTAGQRCLDLWDTWWSPVLLLAEFYLFL